MDQYEIYMKKYLIECMERAKECIVLIPFIILPLLCYGAAKGSETENETQSENYFLPDTVKVEAVETPPQEIIEEKEIIKEEGKSNFIIIKRGTVYNPVPEQTQGDPWKTATERIDSVALYSGKLRWVGVSPDIEAIIPLYSKIRIYHKDPKICGVWQVMDRTREDMISTIDFLRPKHDNKGLWHEIKIEILERGKGK